MVELVGLEPTTSSLRTRRSPRLSYSPTRWERLFRFYGRVGRHANGAGDGAASKMPIRESGAPQGPKPEPFCGGYGTVMKLCPGACSQLAPKAKRGRGVPFWFLDSTEELMGGI